MNRLLKWVLCGAVYGAFVSILAVAAMEWVAGCGESYVDANGVRHINECVVIK
jgi:hypothetical protein